MVLGESRENSRSGWLDPTFVLMKVVYYRGPELTYFYGGDRTTSDTQFSVQALEL